MKPLCFRKTPCLVFVLILSTSVPNVASAQVSFACIGEAFIVQDQQAELFEIDQSQMDFDLMPLGDANMNSECDDGEACNLENPPGTPIEVNALGFRATDGLLYGVQVVLGNPGSNSGIIKIDANGDVFPFGPSNLLPNEGFNAGDISSDGTVMYVNRSGRGAVHRVNLTMDPPVLLGTENIGGFTGAGDVVLDWAYHPDFDPANALLFGADRTGQLVKLDPNCAPADPCTIRQDFNVPGAPGFPDLPGNGMTRDRDYGGAWFDASGRLFLFDNGNPDAMPPRQGQIFEVDLGPDPANPTPTVVSFRNGDPSIRNDAAACVQDIVGAAKQMMTSNGASLPATITIEYTFENFSTIDTLTLVSVIDDLRPVFGMRGTDWTFDSVMSSGISHNTNFNGDTDRELIDQMAPGQDIAPGATATVTVTITLLTDAADTDGDDMYCNQVTITGSVAGIEFGDLSTDGTDPDPNGDGSPDERELSCIMQVPVELMSFSID